MRIQSDSQQYCQAGVILITSRTTPIYSSSISKLATETSNLAYIPPPPPPPPPPSSLVPRLSFSEGRREPGNIGGQTVHFRNVIIHVINKGHSYFCGKRGVSYKSVTMSCYSKHYCSQKCSKTSGLLAHLSPAFYQP